MRESEILKKTFRFERKFVVPYLNMAETEAVVHSNSYVFSEIFYERQINNIYFDSIDMSSYLDNILGNSNRTKVRIRWYGEFNNVKKPVLEFKVKRGLVGTKYRFPLKEFKLPCSLKEMNLIFERSNLPEWVMNRLKTSRFALVNYYKRKYFLSNCKTFRITIDSDLTYRGILNQNFSLLKEIKDKYHILELKYDVNKNAEHVATQFPFRLTKSSKYVNGVTYFRGE